MMNSFMNASWFPANRLAFCGVMLLALAANWQFAHARPQQEATDSELQVLFLGDKGHHVPKQRYDQIVPAMKRRGIAMEYTESLGDMRLENLKRYDALVLYANIDQIDDAAEQGILSYVRQGGGFVPLHCASFCFRNSSEMVNLIGAQFKEHGTGVFRTRQADVDHPINQGFGGFESWDETYVHHLHNDENRTILSYRVDDRGREPWTWVRTEGEGRVFYTAWGHDARTWGKAGFQNLLERGIRWVADQDPQQAGSYVAEREFEVPEMTEIPEGLEFEYEDVGAKIPNYTPSRRWGTQGENLSLMQKPLPPEESIKHFSVPKGFEVKLFASEPDLGGKPIFMSWDHAGRLWVCETVDYPNELRPPGQGRDQIRICEDTDGDWVADKFTVFADELSIPSTLTFVGNGVLVQDGTRTLYMEDTDGDDVADVRKVIYTGWSQGDTHGGVSNFQYGLDNWIWAMQGYNFSKPKHGDQEHQGFRQGFFRMNPRNWNLEYIRPTNNNTWGLGISEEGLIFGSTANRVPSVFMPIPNRYYEQVSGWRTSLTLDSIADTHLFKPVTEKVRQVDHHGGYTAGAGHALYTARQYPKQYWNRTAFVNGPTGHLVGTFVLNPSGAGFTSTSPCNLIASDDEWSAPILSEVGPDGNMWMVDWYNYIVQHNPTPNGFETGKGAAYETDLRDKTHGRIYRIVYTGSPQAEPFSLKGATTRELVDALSNPTMTWRKHAQRLIVEGDKQDAVPMLLDLLKDQSIDEIGLNTPAIHALWTLQGLGVINQQNPGVMAAVAAAAQHPSAGVRRNAVKVMPMQDSTVQEVLSQNLLLDSDAQVRLAAFLALADAPQSSAAGQAIAAAICDASNYGDRWLLDAATSAGATHAASFLASIASRDSIPDRVIPVCEVVAEHYARQQNGQEDVDVSVLVAGLADANQQALSSIVRGLVAGWQDQGNVSLTDEVEADLEKIIEKIAADDRGALLQIASLWGSKRLDEYTQQIVEDLLTSLDDENSSEQERLEAAAKLVSFRSGDEEIVMEILDRITPQTPPGYAAQLVSVLSGMQLDSLGELVIDSMERWSPTLRQTAIDVLLKRQSWTSTLLEAMNDGDLLVADLSLEQRRTLGELKDDDLKKMAVELLERGGALPNADRQAVLEQYMPVVHKSGGDIAKGKEIFKNVCAKCHRHSGEGEEIGPDLTGMAVHPKEELLVHILDPNRSVEANFRMYNVQTIDGLVLSGMLGSESKTAIELIDTQGKKKTVLREDIEDFASSRSSLMPEGFEKEISQDQMHDLLAFLTDRGKFLPLDLAKVSTNPSDRGLFYFRDADVERLIFPDWDDKVFKGVPFKLIDPQDGTVNNAIVFKGGPEGAASLNGPTKVELPLNAKIRNLHFLSGVNGWGFPYNQEKSVTLIVRFHYQDGSTEDHELRNGEHFSDYITRNDVPMSEYAFKLRNQQIRYFAVSPEKSEPIEKVELIKGPDPTAPVVMAITMEGE